MKLRLSEKVGVVDLAPVVDLVPHFWNEWERLRFDGEGYLLNPVTGDRYGGEDPVQIVSGAHREVGAVYRVHYAHKVIDDAGNVVRTTHSHTDYTLTQDDTRMLSLRADAADADSSSGVTLTRGTWLEIELVGTIDLSPLIGIPAAKEDDEFMRRILPFLLEPVRGRLHVDFGALDTAGGRFIEGEGTMRKVRGYIRADAGISRGSWKLDLVGKLKGRGVMRFLLWVAKFAVPSSSGGIVRKVIDWVLVKVFKMTDPWGKIIGEKLEKVDAAVNAAGGPEQYVHLQLWGDGRDPSGKAQAEVDSLA